MRTAARTTAVVAAALLLGGCSASTSAGGTPGPARPTTSAPPTSGTDGPGLRGVPVAAVDCTVTSLQPEGTAQPLPRPPARLVVCPEPPLPAVALSPPPADLVGALSLPDVPPPAGSGAVCALYLDARLTVYAVAGEGTVYRLRIPEDQACHHYLSAAREAVVRHTPVAGPSPGG